MTRRSLTLKDGADALPDGDGTRPVELPQRQLHVEEGHPSENSHQGVGDEKGSCRVRTRVAVTTMAPCQRKAVTAVAPGAAQMRGLDVCLEDVLQIICSERLVYVTLVCVPAPPAAEGGSVWLG